MKVWNRSFKVSHLYRQDDDIHLPPLPRGINTVICLPHKTYRRTKISTSMSFLNSLLNLFADHFEYEDFFLEQILKKKRDHSYRVFKKVNRLAYDFPTAYEYSYGENAIKVWCSNDYLGMSTHPRVKEAVRWVTFNSLRRSLVSLIERLLLIATNISNNEWDEKRSRWRCFDLGTRSHSSPILNWP